ncbi:F-box domain-containing protein [Xylariaceae sp. FL0662B]|nr:F-box domain-containing protein [Xylariaceae sp. FL0662B]
MSEDERVWRRRSGSTSSSSSGPGTTAEQAGGASSDGSKPIVTLNVHNPAVSYGGVNPEIEENVHVVQSVSDDELRWDTVGRRKMLGSDLGADVDNFVNEHSTSGDASPESSCSTNHSRTSAILTLPSELIDSIFSYLSPLELSAASLVCRVLRSHAIADIQWQRHVLSNLPGHRITTPYPCRSWRELYISHDPYWFLTKYKLWFCDRELTGQVIIVRYDERRGCIEGYQLLATRKRDGSEPWLADQHVHIHYFEPAVKLHLDRPILQFNNDYLDHAGRPSDRHPCGSPSESRPFSQEQPMPVHHGTDPRSSNFLLAKPLSRSALIGRMTDDFPYGFVWPPPAIPAHHRVTGQPAGIHPLATSVNYTMSTAMHWSPLKRAEASDQTFRIRQWMEMGSPTLGIRLAEEVVTYSTLDPIVYTPTAEKPWRGVWVGDYSGHGCEFLLINQPDIEGEEDEAPLARFEHETDAEFQRRFLKERVYRGRLEAIKLTGDANVPRGEYTFVANDLGEDGFVGVAQEPPFQGARVVKSRGHIATTGFVNDKYIESRLLLLSHNRLAQYWVGFGHISFFERVDIDQFLTPN